MVYTEPHHQAGRMPSTGNQPAKHRVLGGCRIEVKGLRVKTAGKGDHLGFLDPNGTELGAEPAM